MRWKRGRQRHVRAGDDSWGGKGSAGGQDGETGEAIGGAEQEAKGEDGDEGGGTHRGGGRGSREGHGEV